MNSLPSRPAFFSPLPKDGIWNAAELTRTQFIFILVVSVGLFTFVSGPLWLHGHEAHFGRLTISYVAILPMVAVALWRNGKLSLAHWIVGTSLIAIAKLVITAGLLVSIGIVR